MKKLFFMNCLLVFAVSFSQELQRSERVHGPSEYYGYHAAKLCSLAVPPLYLTYQLTTCLGNTCPNAMVLGVSGLVWMVSMLGVRKFESYCAARLEKAECTVNEFTSLIAQFPEIVDYISAEKRKNYIHCPAEKVANCKLIFTPTELEKMFGGYETHLGIDSNGKPCAEVIIDDEPIRHPLVTVWAKHQSYWKHW